MRSSLVKSMTIVVLFWWVGLALYWSLSDDKQSAASFLAANRFWTIPEPSRYIAALFQWKVIMGWSRPLAALAVMSALAGIGVAAMLIYHLITSRQERIRANGEYSGLHITLGPLPTPREPLRVTGTIDFDRPIVATPAEIDLFGEIIGVLAAHKDAYTGEKDGVSLLDHTTQVVDGMIGTDVPFLAILAAAGDDVGKISSWAQVNGRWAKVKNHCSESARVVSLLPSFRKMPEIQRTALFLTLYFSQTPDAVADFAANPEAAKLAAQMLALLRNARLNPVKPKPAAAKRPEFSLSESEPELVARSDNTPEFAEGESSGVTEAPSTAQLIYKAFDVALATGSYISGGQVGPECMGWRLNGYLYLSESVLQQAIRTKLPPELVASLTANTAPGAMSEITKTLLTTLDEKGLLVRDFAKNSEVPGTGTLTVGYNPSTPEDAENYVKKKEARWVPNPLVPGGEKQLPVHRALWRISIKKKVWRGLIVFKIDGAISNRVSNVQDAQFSYSPPEPNHAPEGTKTTGNVANKMNLFKKPDADGATAWVKPAESEVKKTEPSKPDVLASDDDVAPVAAPSDVEPDYSAMASADDLPLDDGSLVDSYADDMVGAVLDGTQDHIPFMQENTIAQLPESDEAIKRESAALPVVAVTQTAKAEESSVVPPFAVATEVPIEPKVADVEVVVAETSTPAAEVPAGQPDSAPKGHASRQKPVQEHQPKLRVPPPEKGEQRGGPSSQHPDAIRKARHMENRNRPNTEGAVSGGGIGGPGPRGSSGTKKPMPKI